MHSYSQVISLDRCYRSFKTFEVAVKELYRTQIANELSLVDLKNFSFTYIVNLYSDKFYRISGYIKASVIQESAISSKKVTTEINEEFNVVLFPNEKLLDEYLNTHPEDDGDCYSNDSYDVGKLVVEYLSLSLPVYPNLEEEEYKIDKPKNKIVTEEKVSPFEKLKNLKNKE